MQMQIKKNNRPATIDSLIDELMVDLKAITREYVQAVLQETLGQPLDLAAPPRTRNRALPAVRSKATAAALASARTPPSLPPAAKE
jgi:hypothetical protein